MSNQIEKAECVKDGVCVVHPWEIIQMYKGMVYNLNPEQYKAAADQGLIEGGELKKKTEEEIRNEKPADTTNTEKRKESDKGKKRPGRSGNNEKDKPGALKEENKDRTK